MVVRDPKLAARYSVRRYLRAGNAAPEAKGGQYEIRTEYIKRKVQSINKSNNSNKGIEVKLICKHQNISF